MFHWHEDWQDLAPTDQQNSLRPAQLLQTILPIFIALAGIYVIIAPGLYADPRPIWISAALVVPLWLMALYLTRASHWRRAGTLFLSGLWLSVTILFSAHGSLSPSLAGMYLIIIFTAGLFMGQPVAWLFAALTVLTYFGMPYATARGIITPPPPVLTSASSSLGWLINLLLALITLYFIERSFTEALKYVRWRESIHIINEQKYRCVVENANEGIAVMQEGQMRYLNTRALAEVGLTPDEIYTLDFMEFIHPEDRELAQENYRRRLAGDPVPDTYRLRILTPSGGLRWLEVRAVCIEWDEQPATLNFFSDVTEQIEAERALRESEARYRRLTENARDMIYRMTLPDGAYEYVSAAATEITGHPPEAYYQNPELIWEIIHPEWLPYLVAVREGMRAGVVPLTYEYQIVHPADEIRWLDERAVIIRDDAGRPIAVEGIITDITERKRAEDALIQANSLLEAAIASSPAGILIADAPDVTIRMANRAALNIRGPSAELLVDIPLEQHPNRWQTFHPDGTPFAADQLPLSRAILHGETSHNVDTIIRRADGEARWVLANAAPVRDSQGNIIAGVVVFPDITERKRAETALQRRNRDLSLLNRVISTASSTLNPVEVLRVLCQELAQAFDVPQAAATLITPGEDTALVVAEYRAEGRPSGLGLVFSLEEPATAHILRTREPLFIPDAQTDPLMKDSWAEMRYRGTVSMLLVPVVVRGHVISTVGLDALESRSFTEDELALIKNAATAAGQALEAANLHQELQQHAEALEATVSCRTQELREALQQARAADEAKSRFLSNVSHELRTPLTSIRLYLSLLSPGEREPHRRYIESLTRESLRLQTLIESLLTLSRLDLGKITPQRNRTDLNKLLQTLAHDRQQLFEQHGLALQTEFATDLPPVHADVKLLEQVATNLLTNAMHYTPAGGEVRLSTACQDNGHRWVTFCVADTGPGITEADQRHLFERFYRGEAGRTSDMSGTGLGLSICKEIIDLHAGRITVENPSHGGSIFTVWLPSEP